jgi:hypothetical protein
VKKVKKAIKHTEFSKRMINAMTFLWFFIAVFDVGVIIYSIATGKYDYVQAMISDLLTFTGLPISGGIISYFVKSAVENKEKIKGAIEHSVDF